MGVALKFTEETTPNGNVVKRAKINGTLQRLSDKVFSYETDTADGISIVEYKLATVSFTDENSVKHTANNVHVYKVSYEQDMEIGGTYLGSVTRSKNADGTARTPWWTLSSCITGNNIADDDFEDVSETNKVLGI